MFLCTCLCAFAEESGAPAQTAEGGDTITVFHPHGYLDLMAGVQQTLGEIGTLDLNNFNLQLGGGYRFTPLWGLRMTVGGWQSKGGMTLNETYYPYAWNYIAPTLDVTLDLTNAFWGYKEDRIVSWGLFAGPGMNIAFNNQQAAALSDKMLREHPELGKRVAPINALWEGTKVYALGQFGTNVEFRVSERVRIGFEGNINFVDDRYNSKEVGNIDWYFNFLAGVKVLLGKVSEKKVIPAEPAEEILPEKETAAPVDTVPEQKADTTPVVTPEDDDEARWAEVDWLPQYNIYFVINSNQVKVEDQLKLREIAEYMKSHKKTTISVTGYADRGTGNADINMRVSRRRANEVTRILTEDYGLEASRITTDAKGDTVQPFAENDLNRVVICLIDAHK